MNRSILLLIFLALVLACDKAGKKSTEQDQDQSISKMIDRLGGAESWSSLNSIYIKAIHHEKRLSEPYYSEIWRNLEPSEVKIHQWSDKFDIVRYFDDSISYVRRNEKTPIPMDSSSLAFLHNWDKHLYYRTIRELASGNYTTIYENDSTYIVEKEADFIAKIILNDDHLPHKYFTPTISGDTSLTIYSKWKSTAGFTHPVVSMAPDSSFVFEALEWVPLGENVDIEKDDSIKP